MIFDFFILDQFHKHSYYNLSILVFYFPAFHVFCFACLYSEDFLYYENLKTFGHLKNCCNCTKIWTVCFYNTLMHPKHPDRMANSSDPDQLLSAPTGSTLSTQTCLSEYLGSLVFLTLFMFLPYCFSQSCIIWSYLVIYVSSKCEPLSLTVTTNDITVGTRKCFNINEK